MVTSTVINRSRRTFQRNSTLTMVSTIVVLNVVLGAASCIGWVGLQPFIEDLGCWHYIAFHTFLVTGIADLSMKNFDLVPGFGFLSRLATIAVAMFVVFAGGTTLAAVDPITEPAGVFVNVAYYAAMALLFTALTVGLYVYLFEDTEVERQLREHLASES